MRPPISSPFGEPETVPVANKSERIKQGASIRFQLVVFCLPRKSLKETLTEPILIAVTLILVTILTAILFPVTSTSRARSVLDSTLASTSFLELWVLLFLIVTMPLFFLMPLLSLFEVKREKTVILTSYGVSRYEGEKEIELSWPTHLMILNWSGDVLLKTWASGVFIPREAFTSREEAQEFVQIARELRKTGGSAWRGEWKGKVFGQKERNESNQGRTK